MSAGPGQSGFGALASALAQGDPPMGSRTTEPSAKIRERKNWLIAQSSLREPALLDFEAGF